MILPIKTLRTLKVKIVVIARGDVPDSIADTAVGSIHQAIMVDPTCGGLAGVIYDDSIKTEMELADQNAVRVEMLYTVKYSTVINDLTTVQ